MINHLNLKFKNVLLAQAFFVVGISICLGFKNNILLQAFLFSSGFITLNFSIIFILVKCFLNPGSQFFKLFCGCVGLIKYILLGGGVYLLISKFKPEFLLVLLGFSTILLSILSLIIIGLLNSKLKIGVEN